MVFNLSLFSSNTLLFALILLLLQISLVLLYLVDFKSSFPRLVMILLFLVIFFVYFLLICDNIILQNVILSVGDINNEIGTKVNVSGHVHVNDAQSGKALAATGYGLGVGALVGKAVVKAPIPPLVKAGLVIAGAAAGGGFSVGANYANK
jgi:energy-coupling factor transporter transmembrane protein EcfT